MKMTKTTVIGVALAGALAGCVSEKDPLVGNWGMKLPYDSMNAGHMIVSRGEDGKLEGLMLLRWASPEKCTKVKSDGRNFSIVHPWGFLVQGTAEGDDIMATIVPCDKKTGVAKPGEKPQPVVCWRNPPIEEGVSTKDAKFGEPIDLLKDGLEGWQSMDPKAKFGWSIKNEGGVKVLSNALGLKPDGSWAGGGANLMSKRDDFFDFNLSYDVRVPKNSNSGVYLRGRYEIQVVDSYGKPVDAHNMAAYYGRVVPCVAAEKKPGEWQHVDVTLYRRHLTVVLNGVAIIQNAPVVGITGGAIDANESKPGPIYLQGDHSDADYKNMILRKCL